MNFSIKIVTKKYLSLAGERILEKLETSNNIEETKLLLHVAYQMNVPQLDFIIENYIHINGQI